MTSKDTNRRNADEYRQLGLIANPLLDIRNREGEAVGLALEMQAASNRAVVAIDQLTSEERARSLWIDKSTEVASMYHKGATIVLEKELIRDEPLGILPAYVQLFMARSGRMRATLNSIVERLATRDFHVTMGKWLEVIAAEPDEELEEYAAASGEPLEAFVHAVTKDSTQAFVELFGESELLRARPEVIDLRPGSLEEEPEEEDDSVEDDEYLAEQPFAEELEVEEEYVDPIPGYIVAYTRKQLSPVIARALIAYRERGFGEVVNELKITKAPKKTLKALLRLASVRYRKVVVMYDDFNNWAFMPEDLRHKYVASLTELRLILAEHGGMMVFMVNTGTATEIEEQFRGKEEVSWEMPSIAKLAADIDGLDAEMVQSWFDSAALPDGDSIRFGEGVMAELAAAADGSLKRFVAMGAAAIESAVERGAEALSDEDAAAGKEALQAADSSEDAG